MNAVAPKTSVPQIPRSRMDGARSAPVIDGQYFRQTASPYLMDWQPALRETSDDVQAGWERAAARAIDQIQNSGFIAGMCEMSAAVVVGSGLRLGSKPNAAMLKWDSKKTNEWKTLVESRFSAWANAPVECDAGARMKFGEMQQAQYLSWLGTGEILALMPIVAPRRTRSVTKVLNIPATRLSQKTHLDEGLVQGVYVDPLGAPNGYLVDFIDKYGTRQERRMRRFDQDGRAVVSHHLEASIGVTRGITKFAPVLKVVRQLEQYCDATQIAALLQTMFAATITTNMQGLSAFEGLMTEADQTSLDFAKFLEFKTKWYETAKIDMSQHGRIAHLMPNEELKFHKADHPGQQFDMVMQWLTREIALVAGLTYEAATGDYRTATYSSVRMGTAFNWNVITKRREGPPTAFCQSVFETWLEDEIALGLIPFDGGIEGFRANRDAACAATWSGPPKPQADDLKTARAHQTLLEIGATTLEKISSEYGDDWQDVMDQRAREKEYAELRGLPDPHPDTTPVGIKKAEMGDNEDKTDDPSYGGDA